MAKRKALLIDNDMPVAVREKSIALLNQHLADTFDLYSQIKQAHWNIKGPTFIALHEFFDDVAEVVLKDVDTIAERVTALGGTALGTARMAGAASRLPEYPVGAVNEREHLEALVERFIAMAKATRHAIDQADAFGDAGTTDLFTQVSRSLDQYLWFLQSHLVG